MKPFELLPEMLLVVGALSALLGGAFFQRRHCWAVVSAFLVVVSIFVLCVFGKQGAWSVWGGLLSLDAFSLFLRMLILVMTLGIVFLSIGYKDLSKEYEGEYFFFLLVLAVSLMLAVSTRSLLLMYLTVEGVSLISYILAGYNRQDPLASESGIKYFVVGSLSTGIMLYGISLIYGIVGSLDLGIIGHALLQPGSGMPLTIIALILILVGLGFKCSLFPFHMWTPDVYQGSSAPVAALLSLGPKTMGFALLWRVFVFSVPPQVFPWWQIAGLTAILTMSVGNLMALGQGNIKRMLAFSSIAQAGFIFIGLCVVDTAGFDAFLFYLSVYMLMNLAAFGAVVAVSNRIKSDEIEDYAGLYKTDPVTAIFFAIALLSLAGLPPLAGFMAKFLIIGSAVKAGMGVLAIIAVLNSVISLFYYVNVIKVMFLLEPKEENLVQCRSKVLDFILWVLILGNILFGLFPQQLIECISKFF